MDSDLKRNWFQRLFGIPATPPPRDPDCWVYSDGEVVVDLGRAPELDLPDGASRLEGGDLPVSLLVVHGRDGCHHAFHNRCTHQGRCLDPVPGTRTLQCCSVGKSTFDLGGKVLSGPAERSLVSCPARIEKGRLRITIHASSRVDSPARQRARNSVHSYNPV